MGHGTLERNADECGREGELAESAGMDGIRQCLESVFILQTESPSAHPQWLQARIPAQRPANQLNSNQFKLGSMNRPPPPPEETEGGGRNKTGSDFRTWKAESATTTWLELTSSSCRHRFSANDSTTGSTSFKLDNPNPNSNVINQSINQLNVNQSTASLTNSWISSGS